MRKSFELSQKKYNSNFVFENTKNWVKKEVAHLLQIAIDDIYNELNF